MHRADSMVARKVIPALALSLCLVSCGTKTETEYVYKTVEVRVPIMVKPEITPIPKPKLEVYEITKDSTDKEVIEAYYNSVRKLIMYTEKLEEALEPFLKKPE